jgi:hypothetical protein
VRRAGQGTVLPAGTVLTLARLRELVRGEGAAAGGPARGTTAAPSPPAPSSAPAASSSPSAAPAFPPAAFPPGAAAPPEDPRLSLAGIASAAERSFGAAAGHRRASGIVQAILDLETEIQAWAADTDEDQGTEQATVVLRGLVTRLGRAAAEGLNDPRDRLLPAVQPLIALRADLGSSWVRPGGGRRPSRRSVPRLPWPGCTCTTRSKARSGRPEFGGSDRAGCSR